MSAQALASGTDEKESGRPADDSHGVRGGTVRGHGLSEKLDILSEQRERSVSSSEDHEHPLHPQTLWYVRRGRDQWPPLEKAPGKAGFSFQLELQPGFCMRGWRKCSERGGGCGGHSVQLTSRPLCDCADY